jgi:uncharacterized protein with HEPN domain
MQHMLEAARQAMSFIEGRERADLDTDAQLRLALLRALEVVGEAANRVGPETCAAHPEIPWPKVVGIRNRLIHAYFDVDLDIVWKTATESLPELIPLLEDILGAEATE